jgi:hypothetical protein
MKYLYLALALTAVGCKSTREYSTQCNFTVPVDKPVEKSTITIEVKMNGKY